MTGTTTGNINDLLELLNISENILRFNSSIENDIRQHKGTVLYSYNNIIIASEIDDNLYAELQKSPFIETIYELPLKSYGEIDANLIDQLDVSTLNTIIKSGNTGNQSGNSTVIVTGIAPLIINSNLTLSALTKETFTYKVLTSGTTPIKYEISGMEDDPISIIGDTINGSTSKTGTFNISIKVSNSNGFDVKKLVLTIVEQIKIINTNLIKCTSTSSQFTYSIESSGPSPKTYSTSTLPSGLSLSNNVISGIPSVIGTFDISLGLTGTTGSDSKTLTLNIGIKPIITSSGTCTIEQNYETSINSPAYIITSTPNSSVTYSIAGSLPDGLSFKVDSGGTPLIYGTPTTPGVRNLVMKASNNFGESTKQLMFVVTTLPGGGFGGCFIGSARVLTLNGYKKIDEIKIGEQVISNNELNKVLQIKKVLLERTLLYGFNGVEPFITEDHPILTIDGWGAFNPELFKINEPNIYNKLIENQKEIIRINSSTLVRNYINNFSHDTLNNITTKNESNINVYNLFLDGDSTYIVEDIVVHNSKGSINP
jgi:hypothetical protein